MIFSQKKDNIFSYRIFKISKRNIVKKYIFREDVNKTPIEF